MSSGGLRPFFSYFGGKWRAAPRHPKPRYCRIVEPFAGSAGYSLRYPYMNVVLYDASEQICGVWDYLIRASQDEIRALPANVRHVNSLNVCQEAKWLIGFWLNSGTTSPCLTPSAWMRGGTTPDGFWGSAIRSRIAEQVSDIRHWKVFNKSYEYAPNNESTWFIDPPYQGKCGEAYRHQIDSYYDLADWCRNRNGQVIVCEQSGADWLPFRPFGMILSANGRRLKRKRYSSEVVWYNDP